MTNHCEDHNHPDHSSELPRLNRIAGQVDGIKKMIEENRYCPDIMIQLRAVRSALRTIEADILERHLHACVSDAIENGTAKDRAQKLEEIKKLFKKYDD